MKAQRDWQLYKNSRAWDSEERPEFDLCHILTGCAVPEVSKSGFSPCEIKVALPIAKGCRRALATKSRCSDS